MPKIYLKPNSPEYADKPQKKKYEKRCGMPGCNALGDYKAPKHRGLNEYHYFCLPHIREYNKAWNYFEGMSPQDVEDHIINSIYGDRPTWKYGAQGEAYEDIYRQAGNFYYGEHGASSNNGEASGNHHYRPDQNAPEFEAMAIMGLKPPLKLDDVKERYKALVKQHHPDLNKGCKKSEDLLKSINMAYTLLKVAYEKFETLPDDKK